MDEAIELDLNGKLTLRARLVRGAVVAARTGWADTVRAGEFLKIVDPHGKQAGDFWAFNAANPDEHLSAMHTRVWVNRLCPRPGESFHTNHRRPILQLVQDTCGVHDLLTAPCDEHRYRLYGVQGEHASCAGNFRQVMAPYRRQRPLHPAAGESVHERRGVSRRPRGDRRQSIEARRLRRVQGLDRLHRRVVRLSAGIQPGRRLVSDRPACRHLRGGMNTHWRRRRRDAAGPTDRRSAEVSLGTVILTLVAGALLTVTTGLAAMMELEQFGPAVGGIIVFRPDTAATERWSVYATVVEPTRPGVPDEVVGRRCVLSPNVMAIHGGSLVVEARRLSRPPVFRVHWSGGPTDGGPDDCGTTADLVLERTELMRLANVAGGFSSGLRLIGP